MKYKNLTIIGTSHIAKQSLDEVRHAIEDEPPDIICLELDRKRAYALLDERASGSIRLRDIRRIGIKGYIFSIIGAWAERKLGEHVGIKPGAEMKSAIHLAKKKGIRIEYIDQDIEVTLRRFSKSLTWREKWNFLVDIIKGVIFKDKRYMFDLTKVPSKAVISRMIKEVKERYPNIYHVLVEERNEFMAKKLMHILKLYPSLKIVAVVGAGHEEDIIMIIKAGLNRIDISYTIAVGSNIEFAGRDR